ncbi:hypothetical protein [Candidatus Nitrosacidococcus sp. I8]|uniref:hypothetical protein n=1 Tax=Candidatus Nitrosacidococcus sp. I8 TaxID=2942908 RepID=UPI002226B846|nr:hypothetical protein [Candidatus Nitrosacidococcus sp. I8]CAH9017918.1 hypothetical protein NURINAE_00625 [Candidatus Nitrosacidococcus sp. I8]
MRYRETSPEDVVGIQDTGADEGIMMVTAIYSLIVGVGICILGIKKRVFWAVISGASMALASIAYLIASALGYANIWH